jgi:hypothetical protein
MSLRVLLVEDSIADAAFAERALEVRTASSTSRSRDRSTRASSASRTASTRSCSI